MHGRAKMASSSEEEEEVDEVTQQVYWKIEAIIIRLMKQHGVLSPQDLSRGTLEQWRLLGRPEAVGPDMIEARIKYLERREWYALDQEGRYALKDISKQ